MIVSLKKVPIDHIGVLQRLVSSYSGDFAVQLNDAPDTEIYFDALLRVNIASRVYLKLRSRIETTKAMCSFSLKIDEAVIMHEACQLVLKAGIDSYYFSVAHKWRNEIDQQLKSILPQHKNPLNLLK